MKTGIFFNFFTLILFLIVVLVGVMAYNVYYTGSIAELYNAKGTQEVGQGCLVNNQCMTGYCSNYVESAKANDIESAGFCQ